VTIAISRHANAQLVLSSPAPLQIPGISFGGNPADVWVNGAAIDPATAPSVLWHLYRAGNGIRPHWTAGHLGWSLRSDYRATCSTGAIAIRAADCGRSLFGDFWTKTSPGLLAELA
jgi:hypothetical protein